MVLSARPASTWRGVWPIATNVGTGCDGRAGVARRARPARTAKPCGPDSPTLGSSLREVTSRRRWRLSSPALQGERGISRKTVARGMSDDPAEPVVTAACFFCCRRAMGEAITRHSPRPLFRRDTDFAKLGRKRAARMRRCVSILRRHSGTVRRTGPGISRFRVRCCASPRNDDCLSMSAFPILLERACACFTSGPTCRKTDRRCHRN